MKTIFKKPAEIDRAWYLIDAEGETLGRVAAKTAVLLRGKHKPEFAPHAEIGDYVVIINAEKVQVTGRKEKRKIYYRHSGHPGGIYAETLEKVRVRKPTFPLEHAIRGMLPKNRLGRKLFKNVKVYAGTRHPHAAQQPQQISVQ
ncbi:50S ribosomal protein L13 [Spirochaeta africana]|uniref:Large ribosomal subunit protein uL13 n=1 Tax=Spirochaeta africana (strain ATCC 700263 / DSM 8902 / Z-7692) TaxID=889378 RepID=H9UGX2_SPIAZ|nr:50S ribosomal protein L13 [Spirochaeta africana]AFG36765.1 ribosomal protein L13, bacterial type [Spirochaeta africana DSM 8902]